MTSDLGEDLESEILVRLPVKSLMRFKCVQQSWNALFKTHLFVTRHMKNHMRVSDERLMIFRLHNRSYISILRYDSSQPSQHVECSIPDKPLHTGKSYRSYGSCNGVFCLQGYYGYRRRFILWNPATREVKLIPHPPHNPFELEESGLLHGFGVDLNTNDFKFVKSNIDYDNQLHHVSSAELYNLSTNSWTLIHDVTLPPIKQLYIRPETHNALSNGVYHWLIGYDDGGFAYILCFDFRTNKFSKLRGPIAAINDGLFMRDYVAEIDGSIAYVAPYDNPKRLTIWVTNQHGWAKKHTIWRPDPEISIFCILKDGSQFIGGKPREPLTLYNFDAQPVHQFQIEVGGFYQIHKYVESMVPLAAQARSRRETELPMHLKDCKFGSKSL